MKGTMMAMNEDWMAKHFDNMDKEHQQRDDEFRRLCADPCMTPAVKGDRVVVAAGFLGMGFLWERAEAEVMEVGDTSIKVRMVDYQPFGAPKGSLCKWIHPSLITDVLKKGV